MYFIVNPTETLGDTDATPFRLAEKAECARVIVVEILLWDEFEQRFGENDMAIFELVVCVAVRVVDPLRSRGVISSRPSSVSWPPNTHFSTYSSHLLMASFFFGGLAMVSLCTIVA